MNTETTNIQKRFSLAGRRALITGSSRGIGRAFAIAFVEAGASVAIHGTEAGAHSDETLRLIKETSGAGTACFVASDLTRDDGAREAYAQALAGLGGAPDILVCNASLQIPADWMSVTRADFEKQVAVNWRSTLELCQLAAPAMRTAKWGRILMVGSVQEAKPHPHMTVYAGTKCAQTSLAENLARQLARDGITVNNLAPGVIVTDRNRTRLDAPEYAERVREGIPAGFFGAPEDCAGAALLLCSDAGRYITGQTLFADGGMSLA